MDNNEKKATVTDLSEIKELEIEQQYRDIAEGLLRLVERGKTKEEILQILFKDDEVVDMRVVEAYKRVIETAFRLCRNRELFPTLFAIQSAANDYYKKLVEEQKFLYKGKDGKDYSDRRTVDAMDENYINQLYTENQSKHI